jgi:hypothetical protein
MSASERALAAIIGVDKDERSDPNTPIHYGYRRASPNNFYVKVYIKSEKEIEQDEIRIEKRRLQAIIDVEEARKCKIKALVDVPIWSNRMHSRGRRLIDNMNKYEDVRNSMESIPFGIAKYHISKCDIGYLRVPGVIIGIQVQNCKSGDIVTVSRDETIISTIKITDPNHYYMPIDDKDVIFVELLMFCALYVCINDTSAKAKILWKENHYKNIFNECKYLTWKLDDKYFIYHSGIMVVDRNTIMKQHIGPDDNNIIDNHNSYKDALRLFHGKKMQKIRRRVKSAIIIQRKWRSICWAPDGVLVKKLQVHFESEHDKH